MRVPRKITELLEKNGGIARITASMPDERVLKADARIFYAFSDVYRLKIILALSIQPLCVCHIKQILCISAPKLSYHFTILKRNGLVKCRESGNWLIYSLTNKGKDAVAVITGKFARTHSGQSRRHLGQA
jgi:ArsR family transcriptional regulator